MLKCPMSKGMWCHFPQRVERIALQKTAKPFLSQNWEDEKYSYIVVRKVTPEMKEETIVQPDDQWAKLVSTPLKRGGHVVVDSCTKEGEMKRQVIARSHGIEFYTAARKALWGDGLMVHKFPIEILPRQRKEVDLAHNEYIDPKRPWRIVSISYSNNNCR
jgi:ribosomal protein RSM22 (predicted rRNA methylase)